MCLLHVAELDNKVHFDFKYWFHIPLICGKGRGQMKHCSCHLFFFWHIENEHLHPSTNGLIPLMQPFCTLEPNTYLVITWAAELRPNNSLWSHAVISPRVTLRLRENTAISSHSTLSGWTLMGPIPAAHAPLYLDRLSLCSGSDFCTIGCSRWKYWTMDWRPVWRLAGGH